jgi:hypothetical protein
VQKHPVFYFKNGLLKNYLAARRSGFILIAVAFGFGLAAAQTLQQFEKTILFDTVDMIGLAVLRHFGTAVIVIRPAWVIKHKKTPFMA